MPTDAREKQRTHLNLYSDHVKWADENNVNLSAEVRDLLDERINE